MTDHEAVTLKEYLENQCSTKMHQHMAAVSHVEKQVEALEKQMALKFEWLQKNISTTAVALDKRLETMNEFREAIRDQASKFFTRAEHEAYMRIVESELRPLREFRIKLDSMATQQGLEATRKTVLVALALSAVGGLAGVASAIAHFVK